MLAVLALFGVLFAPVYIHNQRLQSFVSFLVRSRVAEGQADDVLRSRVLDKAHELQLPVQAENVHVTRSGHGMRVEVRYSVRVDLPGYTVNLHFYPAAGSR